MVRFIFICTLTFLASSAFSQNLNTAQIVASDTGVLVRITNNDSLPATFLRLSVEKKIGMGWSTERVDIGCPCQTKCKGGLNKIESGEEREFIWDGKSDECMESESGEYRIVIRKPNSSYELASTPFMWKKIKIGVWKRLLGALGI